MTERHRTDYQIKQIMKYNRDGSPDKQKSRHQNLMRCITELRARGYSKRWDIHKIGEKEAHRLVRDWRDKGLKHKTIANRMADIRWIASKVNRQNHIPSNRNVGIALRENNPGHGENKSSRLEQNDLDQMDQRMQLINLLKAEFGLREKEAMMFQHNYATSASDSYIRLKGNWCKGGRPRSVEITNDQQRSVLRRVKEHQQKHGEKSMIPANQKYMSYKKQVQAKSTELGIKGHGFRHQWAQNRFIQITGGIQPPIMGGQAYSSLDEASQVRWNKAARLVNEELGHGRGREDITATYIGVRI